MAETQYAVWPILEGWQSLGRHGRQDGPAGLLVQERSGAAIASVTVRAGRDAALADAVQAHFGTTLPKPGKCVTGNPVTWIGTGPGQWLAEASQTPQNGVEQALRSVIGAHAAIVDQSHARIILRLSGPRVRDVLATGVPLDLHPRAFAPGDAAQTLVAHIGVQIWQIAADPIYEMAVPRSMIGSFWGWLEHAALRHGLKVRPALSTCNGETPQ